MTSAVAETVYSAVVGTNADLFAEAYRLYIDPDDKVLDLTYGKGVFWRHVNHPNLVRNDLHVADADTHEDFHDLSAFEPDSFDAVVFDPPYKTGSSAQMQEPFDGYRNNDRPGRGVKAVREMYAAGLEQGLRVVKPGGLLMVKVMDQVESGRQHWLSIDVYLMAKDLGLEAPDRFMLLRRSKPPMRHDHQIHARKRDSYLWVMRRARGKGGIKVPSVETATNVPSQIQRPERDPKNVRRPANA